MISALLGAVVREMVCKPTTRFLGLRLEVLWDSPCGAGSGRSPSSKTIVGCKRGEKALAVARAIATNEQTFQTWSSGVKD